MRWAGLLRFSSIFTGWMRRGEVFVRDGRADKLRKWKRYYSKMNMTVYRSPEMSGHPRQQVAHMY